MIHSLAMDTAVAGAAIMEVVTTVEIITIITTDQVQTAGVSLA